ncbi:MAG: hypothetical protein H6Q17_645 [Bacteroidetes bacterium]|nr:hypothetical protein [Bacteroidota bacterium]
MKLFFQKDNASVYVNLDGGLRHIPNPATFTNLFDGNINPSNYIQFEHSSDSPLPIIDPIIDNAKLVHEIGDNASIYLTDSYDWSPENIILRHVINPAQMEEIGFSWNKVVPFEGTPNVGVPIATDSKNIDAIKKLNGYYAVYNYFFFGSPLNPFFEDVLKEFPGRPATKYKAQLKELIVNYQTIVNNLPNG